MNKKVKVLVLGDDIRSTSGVAGCLRTICEALVNTGRFQVVQLGGAIKHMDYRTVKFNEYGDDLIVVPVDGFGNPDVLRSIIRDYKPDQIVIQSDPRFYVWFHHMENEIRLNVPIIWNVIWDAPPVPSFNKPQWGSNDVLVAISKNTWNLVKRVTPDVENFYVPHAVNDQIFKPLTEEQIRNLRKENFPGSENKMLFFWNNRNARRKQSGTLIWWFKKFLDKVGHDKAHLLMHTDPKDEHGQDLYAIIKELNLDSQKQVLLSSGKLPPEHLAAIYNMADCTINISDAEGFGLGTLESLSCETPIIVTMTGGLQEQVTDYSETEITDEFILERNRSKPGFTLYEHGIGIEPASKAIIGSQGVPFIYEDRLNENDFVNSLVCFYNMTEEERKTLGRKGREHVLKNYNFKQHCNRWVEILDHVYETRGSWPNKKYKPYELIEL